MRLADLLREIVGKDGNMIVDVMIETDEGMKRYSINKVEVDVHGLVLVSEE